MEKTEQEKKLMKSQIDLFEKKYGWVLEVKEGVPYYYGSISCISDELPDNLVINGNLFCHVRSTKLPKGLKVTGCLDAAGTKITEIPDDCEFSYLDISNTRIQKLRDNLVLEALIAYNSSLIDLPKGLKVKGDLNISNTSITEIPDDCEFDGLYMFKTKITKLHDNMELNYLNVGGSPLTELPKNLVIYDFLNIENTRIKCMSENYVTPLICCNFELNDERYEKNKYGTYQLKDEIVHISHPSGREFLNVDGILSEVIEKKENVYHVRTGVNDPISYIVTDGNNHWAYGDTLDEAKQDLIIKINERDKSDHDKLTLDSDFPF